MRKKKMALAKLPCCVVDIGSNSVRAVFYDVYSDGTWRALPKEEYKTLCKLGADIQKTGKLSVEGKDKARAVLAEFVKRAEELGARIYAVGTAALRDATDGAEFCAEMKQKHGLEINVIDGDTEARLSALGVCSGFKKADGIVADQGGGSLDMARVKDGHVKENTYSFQLGNLRLKAMGDGERARQIGEELDTLDYRYIDPENLYIVGGTFRAIGRACLAQRDNKEDLHGLSFSPEKFMKLLDDFAGKTPEQIMKEYGIKVHDRAEQMRYASELLQVMIDDLQPKQIVFSRTGLREGILADRVVPMLMPELKALEQNAPGQKKGLGSP
ncbi:MAG: hypothetical protein GC136_03250 [Alphaproteobacteria bacterium]|nr:hypothetical protein [Alphaproteobacteria bacterium]